MWEVKHFTGGTNKQALDFMDNEIKQWLNENQVGEIKAIKEFFGQSQSGAVGAAEPAVFISIWYQK